VILRLVVFLCGVMVETFATLKWKDVDTFVLRS
jgi:hypothetical protein